MSIIIEKFEILTNGPNDVIDVTDNVKNIISKTNLDNASIFLTVSGSFASIVKSNRDIFEKISPSELFELLLNEIKVFDLKNNLHRLEECSIIKSLCFGNNINLVVQKNILQLGWDEKIFLFDFATERKKRTIWIQIIY